MTRYEPFDWYETPVYYDIIFDSDTDTEADFLAAAHAEFATSRGMNVLEPACGSGRLVSAMAFRGFDVTGFDIVPEMLDFARQRLNREHLDATLTQARMEDFRYRTRFDLAHCLVSTFKYLDSEAAARAHLECVARHLKVGGVYVLGMHLTDYDDRQRNRERWVASRDDTHVVCNIQGWPADRRTRTERVRSRLIVNRPGGERRFETEWTFRTYSLRQLKTLLRSVPALEHVATYDFTHRIDHPIAFDGSQLDVLLVLRRVRTSTKI